MVDDLLPNVQKRKQGFELKSRQTITHPSGRTACVIEYTHNQRGIPLRERELIMPLGDKLVLFATASGGETLWNQYEPAFSRVLDSIDIAKGKDAK
jgi:hypothetical protein